MGGDHDPWHTGWVALDVLAVSHGAASGITPRQRARLEALIEVARAAPYWRERLAGMRTMADFGSLAPVSKKELMSRFDATLTDVRVTQAALRGFVADPSCIGEPFAGRFVVWESSGSSGVPGLFVQDPAAMAVYDALEALRRPALNPWRRWVDPWGLAERFAFVGATGGHFASTVSLQRLRRLQPGLADRARGFDFLQPLPALVAQLEAFAPTVLATYPSAALLLADEARAGRLRLSLSELWTGGEALSATMRAGIESAFGCPVANSYGASEFLAIASPCAHGALHLNADWVMLEPVDAAGRPVPPGVCGERTWLTNLANHVQPLIRYELGDRVTLLAQPCACGSPLPAIEVQGRSDDVLSLRGASGRDVRLLPLALTTVLEERGGVVDFQLVQTGPAGLRLELGPRHGEADAACASEALRSWLHTQGLPRVRLSVRRVAAFTPGRSGKLQRVKAAHDA